MDADGYFSVLVKTGGYKNGIEALVSTVAACAKAACAQSGGQVIPCIDRVFSSNLKGGFDVHLSSKTLLVGPSGSGKSAVINAIESSLFGYVGDWQARSSVQKPAWLATLTDDGEEPDVEVFRSTMDYDAAHELYRETEQALQKSPETAWRALLRLQEPETAVTPPWLSVVALDQTRAVLGAFYAIRSEDPPIEFLQWFARQREVACRPTPRRSPFAQQHSAAALFHAARQYLPGLGHDEEFRPTLDGHAALSGAEWVQTVTALACARAVPGDLNLVIPADRAMDVTRLQTWMAQLTPAPVQVILTAVQEPAQVPLGWTVVRFPARSPQAPPTRRPRQAEQVVPRGRRSRGRRVQPSCRHP